jgi:hypothetical protein
MSATFKKFVLPSLCVSGAVFAVLAVPLAVYSSEKVDVQVSDSIGITGTVQDFTAPYLGLSAFASFAIGSGTATVLSVAASRKHAQQAEKDYLEAKTNFQNRERQLQEVLLSDASLAKSGLSFFLDEPESEAKGTALTPLTSQATVNVELPNVSSVIVPNRQPMTAQGFTVNSGSMGVQPVKIPRVTAQIATSPLHAAHGFMSFARAGQVVSPAAIAWAEERNTVVQQAEELAILQGQLKDLMLRIEQLQVSLKPKAIALEAQYSDRIEVIAEPRPLLPSTAHRAHPFDAASWATLPQRLAS